MDSTLKAVLKRLTQSEVLRQILGEEAERLKDTAAMCLEIAYRDLIFIEKKCGTGKHSEAAEQLQKIMDLLEHIESLEELGRTELWQQQHPDLLWETKVVDQQREP